MSQTRPLASGVEPRITPSSEPVSPGLDTVRPLWHYQPGFDYRPDLYEYNEFDTTDPAYVVLDVQFMTPSPDYVAYLGNCERGISLLVRPSGWHVSREAGITGIPAAYFEGDRNHGSLNPDLAVWPFPEPQPRPTSYAYDQHGVPELVLEAVAHSQPDVTRRDTTDKKIYYANMGIREYWLLNQEAVLSAYTLTQESGFTLFRSRYAPITTEAAGLYSTVLGGYLHWQDEVLLYRHDVSELWRPLASLDVEESRQEGEVLGELRIISSQLREALGEVNPDAVAHLLSLWTNDPPEQWPSLAAWDRLREEPHRWREILLGDDTPLEGAP